MSSSRSPHASRSPGKRPQSITSSPETSATTPRQIPSKVLRNPVVWISDKQRPACYQCRRPFGIVRRRHHCRICGEVVCSSCSRNRVHVVRAWDRQRDIVRSCDRCYADCVASQKQGERGGGDVPNSPGPGSPPSTSASERENASTTAIPSAAATADEGSGEHPLLRAFRRPKDFDQQWRIILLSSLFLVVSSFNFGILSLPEFLLGVSLCLGVIGVPIYLKLRSGKPRETYERLLASATPAQRKAVPASSRTTTKDTFNTQRPSMNAISDHHPALIGIEDLGHRARRPLLSPKWLQSGSIQVASVRLAFAPASGQPEISTDVAFEDQTAPDCVQKLQTLSELHLGPVGDGAPFAAEVLLANTAPESDALDDSLTASLEILQNDTVATAFRTGKAPQPLKGPSRIARTATHRLLLRGKLPTRMAPLDALIFRFTVFSEKTSEVLCQWEQPFSTEHESPLTILRMYIRYEGGREPVDLRLTTVEHFHLIHRLQGKVIHAAEGETSQETICFRISRDVEDLEQVKHFKRGRLGLGEKRVVIGSFKASPHAYFHHYDAASTPSGILARGLYHQTVYWTDRSGERYLEAKDQIRICKASDMPPPEE